MAFKQKEIYDYFKSIMVASGIPAANIIYDKPDAMKDGNLPFVVIVPSNARATMLGEWETQAGNMFNKWRTWRIDISVPILIRSLWDNTDQGGTIKETEQIFMEFLTAFEGNGYSVEIGSGTGIDGARPVFFGVDFKVDPEKHDYQNDELPRNSVSLLFMLNCHYYLYRD